MGKIGSAFYKGFNADEMQRGTVIYSMYAVVDPEYAKKRYSLRFWWQVLSTAKLGGFHTYYARFPS